MFQNIFNALVRKKQRIIRSFNILWVIILVVYFAAFYATIAPNHPQNYFWYTIALRNGRIALSLFVLLLLPGIFKRFEVRHRVLGIIMIFRRQLGITMFLLVAFHSSIVSLIPKLTQGVQFQLKNFEIFGLTAFILLFFLFITSNDLSQLKLGKWWYRLHRLVYIIMWLILFHVALQRISIWSIIAGALVLSEMSGIIYSNFRKKLARKS